jgi:hypothetical protein
LVAVLAVITTTSHRCQADQVVVAPAVVVVLHIIRELLVHLGKDMLAAAVILALVIELAAAVAVQAL